MSPSVKPLEEVVPQRRIPGATYRWQFNRDFTFAQASENAEYLRELGITDVYASPLFQAGPDSTHGYDICSFEELNPTLGSRQDFETLTARLRELGLGLILDMVPNHMGNDLSNCWWVDVLEHGRTSPFATYFDIDWQPLNSDLHDKILLPTLEDHYAQVLESGKLQLVCTDGDLAIAYHDRKFPVTTHCYAAILEEIADVMGSGGQEGVLTQDIRTFAKILREPERASKGTVQKRIQNWSQTSPVFREALAAVCRTYNGEPGKPRSFDKLHRLLSEQHYRLAYWRVGPEEINYRRFFDVTQLVSVRMELPDVFQACHRFVFELLQKGQLTGLRIDHPDGLWDPKGYFRQLQAGFLLAQTWASEGQSDELESTVREWLTHHLAPIEQQLMHEPIQNGTGHTLEAPRSDPLAGKTARPDWPLYIVAEKILSGEEPLRPDWPVEGTTGYDFLNQVNGLFVDQANEEAFDRLYHQFTGNHLSFRETVYLGKKRILERSLVSEVNALTHRLKQVAVKTRYGQDFSFRQLHVALNEVIAAFPVYRSYVSADTTEVIPRERFYVEQAIAEAKARNPGVEAALFEFMQDILLLRAPADFDDEAKQLQRDFISRFQQLTGPTTAKGLEDTAFYNYNRLISVNEVGGNADRFGVSVDDFHQYNLSKAEQWPHSLLATATHDTKRGEDVRARINVLSEIPADWQAALQRWSEFNADKKTPLHGQPAPHPNDEYLLYQTLVGAWPFHSGLSSAGKENQVESGSGFTAFRDRIVAYMSKALKEAKAHTSWTDPNTAYEEATKHFVEQILTPNLSAKFLVDFQVFQLQVAFFGKLNSLSQLLLKIISPGVPDFYQGTELWDFGLVDPDNRRPVDYEVRQRLLEDLRKKTNQHVSFSEVIPELLKESHTGQVKLHVIARALALRQRHQELFSLGGYVPLKAVGAKKEHVCAFARVLKNRVIVTVIPRLVHALTSGAEQLPVGVGVWHDTALDLSSLDMAGSYENVLTGEGMTVASSRGSCPLAVSAALRSFPVALLERTSAEPRE